MTYPKLLALVTTLLFALIAVLAFMKGGKASSSKVVSQDEPTKLVAVELGVEVREIKPQEPLAPKPLPTPPPLAPKPSPPPLPPTPPAPIVKPEVIAPPAPVVIPTKTAVNLPVADRMNLLFNKSDPKFPFVETIVYKSKVAWQKGRPAWLADYANYYSTSRHFIARSLNGKGDYNKQDLAEGDRFNVYRKDKNITFNLLVDLSHCKLWLYCLDTDKQERYLIKSYDVSLGRREETCTSGFLTPIGTYSLGSKIAIYKPKIQGFHNGKKVEMLRIFGTRWIPFEKEIKDCSAPAKALGIHGVPWHTSAKGDLVEDLDCLGKYESDGCVRLSTNDIEEIFSIIITKPTTIELVADFNDAELPGKEWGS